jgi:hypothetical protein
MDVFHSESILSVDTSNLTSLGVVDEAFKDEAEIVQRNQSEAPIIEETTKECLDISKNGIPWIKQELGRQIGMSEYIWLFFCPLTVNNRETRRQTIVQEELSMEDSSCGAHPSRDDHQRISRGCVAPWRFSYDLKQRNREFDSEGDWDFDRGLEGRLDPGQKGFRGYARYVLI